MSDKSHIGHFGVNGKSAKRHSPLVTAVPAEHLTDLEDSAGRAAFHAIEP